mmetsp:Transcript_64885/g.89102  ORF Transcript_64885/g.89102 Transcript_64885/m.89102 type:complete len:170 (-) Transcript_64885:29-538(-)
MKEKVLIIRSTLSSLFFNLRKRKIKETMKACVYVQVKIRHQKKMAVVVLKHLTYQPMIQRMIKIVMERSLIRHVDLSNLFFTSRIWKIEKNAKKLRIPLATEIWTRVQINVSLRAKLRCIITMRILGAFITAMTINYLLQVQSKIKGMTHFKYVISDGKCDYHWRLIRD